MTKFAKGDQVRVHATQFDGEGEKDDLGLTFSEKWLRDGNGVWCCGKISFVLKKKSRQQKKYRILYHEGTSMESLERDIKMAPENEEKSDSDDTQEDVGLTVDREDEGDDDRHPYDQYEDEIMQETMMGEARDDGNVELLESDEDEDGREDETVKVGGVQYPLGKKRKTEPQGIGSEILMGETMTAGEYTWTRIEGMTEDSRKEPHFETTLKSNLLNDETTEVDRHI
jgi:hypothetical protein